MNPEQQTLHETAMTKESALTNIAGRVKIS